MSGFYVRTVPYAGDLPYLEISAGQTTMFMSSRKDGTFDVYRHMAPRLSLQQQRNKGVRMQPGWAFLISNGKDEVFLRENTGRPGLAFDSRGSATNTLVELQEADAESLSASLASALAEPTSKLPKSRVTIIKPLAFAHMYDADEWLLGFH